MRKHSPQHVQVKASGGIRTLDALLAMRDAGATRVGSSSTAQILEECRKRLGMETAVAK
jgi:deoxyribose-phosphate aldolase